MNPILHITVMVGNCWKGTITSDLNNLKNGNQLPEYIDAIKVVLDDFEWVLSRKPNCTAYSGAFNGVTVKVSFL